MSFKQNWNFIYILYLNYIISNYYYFLHILNLFIIEWWYEYIKQNYFYVTLHFRNIENAFLMFHVVNLV